MHPKKAPLQWPSILLKSPAERGSVLASARKGRGGTRVEEGKATNAMLDGARLSLCICVSVVLESRAEQDMRVPRIRCLYAGSTAVESLEGVEELSSERREDSSQASTSGRSSTEQAFIDMGVDDRITVGALF